MFYEWFKSHPRVYYGLEFTRTLALVGLGCYCMYLALVFITSL